MVVTQTLKFIYNDDRRLLPFKSLSFPVVVNSGELSWPRQHGAVKTAEFSGQYR